MDSLLLTKLPPEIRLRIYKLVYYCPVVPLRTGYSGFHDNPKIKILVTDVAEKHPLAVTYRLNPKCGLTFTCRLIKAESWVVMWRSALVSVHFEAPPGLHFPSYDSMAIYELNKVLPDEIAQNITYLSNIKMASLQRVQSGSCESMSTSLLKYPRLKACCLDYYCFEYFDRLCTKNIDGMDVSEYGAQWCEGSISPDILRPFELESGKKPPELLEELFGLGMKPDGVQMLV